MRGFFIIATENWETRQLVVGHDKEFLSSIKSIGNLYTSIVYIDRYSGILEAFNTIKKGLCYPQINRLYTLHVDPTTMCNFMKYIDHSVFSTLKDNSYLLEHGKQIITDNQHPLWRFPFLIHTYSKGHSYISSFLLHAPWSIRQVLNFVLDDFTFLGEVSANIEPAALKERRLIGSLNQHRILRALWLSA